MKPILNHIDGWLYVGIAVCPAAAAALSVSEATQFVPPFLLFWGKFFFGVAGVAMTAGKAYRSTNFAAKQNQDQAASGAPQAVPVVATMQPETLKPETTSPAIKFDPAMLAEDKAAFQKDTGAVPKS